MIPLMLAFSRGGSDDKNWPSDVSLLLQSKRYPSTAMDLSFKQNTKKRSRVM